MTDEQFDEYISARRAALEADLRVRRNEIKKRMMQTHLNVMEQYTSLCVDNKVEEHVTELFLNKILEIAFSST